MEEKNDHDLIITIDVKLDELKNQFSNHLKHHWAITITLLSITLTSLISTLVMVLK